MESLSPRYGRLDVRATLQTDDGALIYMQYYGVLVLVLVLGEAATAALGRGEAINFGDSYFMTSPRVETGDPRYAWLNAIVAVAEGRALPGALEYRVYQAGNG